MLCLIDGGTVGTPQQLETIFNKELALNNNERGRLINDAQPVP